MLTRYEEEEVCSFTLCFYFHPIDQPLRTTGAMNNSSSFSVQETSSPLLITYVNISMTIVALATLSHISALFTLFRDRRLRRKIMSPFMINISVISLVLSIGGYAVTLGTDFKRQTRNNTQAVYLCNWVTFVGLLSKNAFLSTLCAMNIVSKLASDRCTRGVAQQITRKSNIIIFSASWLYSILMSVPINFEDSLSALSASQLTCNLNWTSREKLHFLYNALVAITTLLLPMVICFAMQYHCARSVDTRWGTPLCNSDTRHAHHFPPPPLPPLMLSVLGSFGLISLWN